MIFGAKARSPHRPGSPGGTLSRLRPVLFCLLVAVTGCGSLRSRARAGKTLAECETTAYLKECGYTDHPLDCAARRDAIAELVAASAFAQGVAERGGDATPAKIRLGRAVERMLKAWTPSAGRPSEPCSSRSSSSS